MRSKSLNKTTGISAVVCPNLHNLKGLVSWLDYIKPLIRHIEYMALKAYREKTLFMGVDLGIIIDVHSNLDQDYFL
jgi:hypothetical protein